MIADADAVLRRLLDAALAAADPAELVPRHLPPPPRGRAIVLGAGKAAAAMARAVESHWLDDLGMTRADGKARIEGLVVTLEGHGAPTRRIDVIEAALPMPHGIAKDVATRMLALATSAGPDDLVLVLLSGGASALLALPAPGLDYGETLALNPALVEAGATISEVNCVRKHLSAVKAGRLALAAAPAPVLALLIADVGGDDMSVVGSGPTLADPTTLADARAVLDRYRIVRSAAVDAFLADPENETPKPGDPRLAGSSAIVLSGPRQALDAAAAAAKAQGITPVVLGDSVQGHARDIAAVQASLALEVAAARQPIRQRRVMLSAGETVPPDPRRSRGGRNTLYLLALAVALNGHPGIYALACDTDGLDGVEDNAGAIVRPDTLARATALGIDARQHLDHEDAYTFFAALGDLVMTGPTLTNVNDFRATLIT